jgi:hypothetical protein
MRRLLSHNGQSKESKHNLKIPVETEFSNLICPTSGKPRLLTEITPHSWRPSFLNNRGRENHVVHGIMG